MDFHDTRETRDPEARERELLIRLPAQIAHARAAAPAFGRLLADVDPETPSLALLEEAFYDPGKRAGGEAAFNGWLARYAARLDEDPLSASERRAPRISRTVWSWCFCACSPYEVPLATSS